MIYAELCVVRHSLAELVGGLYLIVYLLGSVFGVLEAGKLHKCVERLAFLVAVIVAAAEDGHLILFHKTVYQLRHLGSLLYAYRRMIARVVCVIVCVANDETLSARLGLKKSPVEQAQARAVADGIQRHTAFDNTDPVLIVDKSSVIILS